MERHPSVILLFSLLLGFTACSRNINSFPQGFEFGSATSAYQIEGGWNSDGKGWSIWDHLARTRPESVQDFSNGDDASKSYYFYKRDVEILKELGVKNYRFSISWPRILPYGRPDYVNPAGVAYYNALIDELLANGITPFPTMYHWDLPQNLQEQGGWLNEDVVDWFTDYARVLYQHFGDRVKYWMTVNEAHTHCLLGYELAIHAPRVSSPGVGYYECSRNTILAHAKAYRLYDAEFRRSQGGEVGVVEGMDWGIPESNSEDDLEALQNYITFTVDKHIHPIFSEKGNFPQRMIDIVNASSIQQGLPASRLRPFTDEQAEIIKGSADFLGLNHYSTRIVYRNESLRGTFDVPSSRDDSFYGDYPHPSWHHHGGFVYEYAQGFHDLLMYLNSQYNIPKIYITENGCPGPKGLNDTDRVRYYRDYMSAMIDAIEKGVNVKGYFAWSVIDSFEWNSGYTISFGLYDVDMDDPNRKRTAKKSALVYREMIRSGIIDYDFDADPYAQSNAYGRNASIFITLLLTTLKLLV